MATAALSLDLAIVLLAATVAGFLAKQTGQPTIIAYILAGVVVGPVVFGFVEVTEITETLSELGLAFLLFLLGIKMRIEEIKHVLVPIVKISLPQMAAVAAVGIGVSVALGFSLIEAIIIGLAVMYSSTAVVIKMLTDLDEATTLHGKIDVGVLLVQDIVVVIILAVLAAGRPESVGDVATTLGIVLALVAAVTVAALAASKYALPVVFSRIADNRRIFFLVAISWAFLFVFVSDNVNLFLAPLGIEAYLSIEMGAFLAGVAIAQLPYSKQLQDRVNPLTDLFVMIFFASVALSLERSELLFFWQEAVVAAIVLMLGKFVVFFALLSWQRFDRETTFLGSLYMIQVSEFGVVVGVAAVGTSPPFIGVEILGFLTLLALITMTVSVYFFAYGDAIFDRIEPYLKRFEAKETFTEDKREYKDHAIVVGYDDLSQSVIDLLEDHYEDVVIVDRRTDHVRELERKGHDVVFGDFGSATIRKDIAVKKADFVFSTSVQPEIGKRILAETPDDATVVVEARTDADARALYEEGADYVVRSVALSSERLADYLTALVEDRDTFDRAATRDAELLRDPDPYPDLHDRLEGQLDD